MPFEGYRALFGSLRDCAFLYGDSDGVTGDEGTRGRGATESAARLSALLREPIGFAVFSAGSTLGLNVEAALRPPQTCAKESNVEAALRPLWTLLTLRRSLLAGIRFAVTRVYGKT